MSDKELCLTTSIPMSSPSVGGARAELVGGGGVIQSIIEGRVGQISLKLEPKDSVQISQSMAYSISTVFSSWFHNESISTI